MTKNCLMRNAVYLDGIGVLLQRNRCESDGRIRKSAEALLRISQGP